MSMYRAGMRSRWPKVLGLALAMVFLAVASVLAQQADEVTLYKETFDDGEAPGWLLAQTNQGVWVVEGEMLYGQGRAGALYARGEWEDVRLALDVMLLDKAGAVRMGVRHSEAGRYILTLYPDRAELARQAEFGRVENIELLAEPRTIKLALKEPHAVELIAYGGRLSASIDGRTIFEMKEPQRPLPAGSISLESLAGSSAFVDNIRVYGAKELTPTDTPPAQLSDLVVFPVEDWGYEKECTVIRFAVTIANHGAEKSPPTTLGVADINAKWEMGFFDVEALPRDAALTLDVFVPVPSEQWGREHEIVFMVDPESAIEESNKTNNMTVLGAPPCESEAPSRSSGRSAPDSSGGSACARRCSAS